MTALQEHDDDSSIQFINRFSLENAEEDTEGEPISYQESARFATWRKHTRDLYESMLHCDLVWESPSVQLMPYMTVKDHVATQTVLCGTRTGGQEQNYVQFFSMSLPFDTAMIDEELGGFCEATGEVGGFGMAPSAAGMRIERRMFHDGDVLCARYMHANPLLIGTASSNGYLYVFDWSRISLQSKPNKPERPRGPLLRNALSDEPTEEERSAFEKRCALIEEVAAAQSKWDAVREPGQHVLSLRGPEGPLEATSHLDWNTTEEGLLATGARNGLYAWKIGLMSKEDDRHVAPFWSCQLDDDIIINDTHFSWGDPNMLLAGATNGFLYHADTRSSSSGAEELLSFEEEITSVAVCPMNSQLIAVATAGGNIATIDLRYAAEPTMHGGFHQPREATIVSWCPHRESILATAGEDGFVNLFDVKQNKMLFRHAAHTETVTDMSWGWQDAFAGQIVSVDRNAICLWKPRERFFELP